MLQKGINVLWQKREPTKEYEIKMTDIQSSILDNSHYHLGRGHQKECYCEVGICILSSSSNEASRGSSIISTFS
jgi:hypothetical protein